MPISIVALTHHCINQSINQSINHGIEPAINRLLLRSLAHHFEHATDWSIEMLRMCQLFAACQCYQLPRTIHHLRHPFLLDRRIRNVSCPSSSSSSSSFHPPLNEIYHNDDDDVNFFYLTTATSTVTVLQNAQEVAIFTILSKNFLFHVSMFFFSNNFQVLQPRLLQLSKECRIDFVGFVDKCQQCHPSSCHALLRLRLRAREWEKGGESINQIYDWTSMFFFSHRHTIVESKFHQQLFFCY